MQDIKSRMASIVKIWFEWVESYKSEQLNNIFKLTTRFAVMLIQELTDLLVCGPLCIKSEFVGNTAAL